MRGREPPRQRCARAWPSHKAGAGGTACGRTWPQLSQDWDQFSRGQAHSLRPPAQATGGQRAASTRGCPCGWPAARRLLWQPGPGLSQQPCCRRRRGQPSHHTGRTVEEAGWAAGTLGKVDNAGQAAAQLGAQPAVARLHGQHLAHKPGGPAQGSSTRCPAGSGRPRMHPAHTGAVQQAGLVAGGWESECMLVAGTQQNGPCLSFQVLGRLPASLLRSTQGGILVRWRSSPSAWQRALALQVQA